MTISATPAAVEEFAVAGGTPSLLAGEVAGVFTLSHDGSTAQPVRVELTLDGWAQLGADYLFVGADFQPDPATQTIRATVTIPQGSSSTLFGLLPQDDALSEGEEDVMVSVAGRTSSAAVTIRDDEPTVSITANAAQIAEDATGVVTYTLSHDAASGESVTGVVKLLDNDTATHNVDYSFTGATFTRINHFGNRHEATLDLPANGGSSSSHTTFTLGTIDDQIDIRRQRRRNADNGRSDQYFERYGDHRRQ